MPTKPTKKPTPSRPTPTPAPDQIPVAAAPSREPLAPIGANGAPKPTVLQTALCEIASDIIFNGGDPEDLSEFLGGLASHNARRQFTSRTRSEARVGQDLREWRREIARTVPELPVGVVSPQKPASSSVSELVRQNLRYRVARGLDYFVRDANFHELHFMMEVLDFRESNNSGAFDQLPIAEACSYELDRGENLFFIIPETMEPAFIAFREALQGNRTERDED